ncbi:hypothetical protein GDO81_023992 [Engystomops pustulosus]|uniref:Uncharacterized protein n=1 Tax=Engystomops pustulosus TaxID=76066 RepID=A0AAV6ZBR7_ENGPU|nr:hypothetical protein GDO81_023992 [Engystomops pustulosus]
MMIMEGLGKIGGDLTPDTCSDQIIKSSTSPCGCVWYCTSLLLSPHCPHLTYIYHFRRDCYTDSGAL